MKYLNNDGTEQWPTTRGNHTDEAAIDRVSKMPEEIRDHVWTNDPCWGYVPDGWRQLVIDLHKELVQVAPEYRIGQVKEKFGGLRFYVNLAYAEDCPARAIINKYEELSFKTCDVCAEPGMCGTVNNWVATRCAEHGATNERAKVTQYNADTHRGG